MDISSTYKQMLNVLSPKLGDREAQSICDIYFEDRFSLKKPFGRVKLSGSQLDQLKIDTKKLLDGFPIQYLTGRSNFYGYNFKVNSSVLIPRPETEELVYWIVSDFKNSEGIRILDIGTGSGCIPVSIKKQIPTAIVEGLDISEKALKIAQENASSNDCNIDFFHFDILENSSHDLPRGYDVLVSNPPYVTTGELDKSDSLSLLKEPKIALFVPEEEPLLFYDRIIQLALFHETTKHIYFEINEYRVEALKLLMQRDRIKNYEFRNDLQGKCRMLKINL